MAARIKKILHDEDTRLKIKVGNIITRMQRFALARPVEVPMGEGVILTRFEDEDGREVWPMTKEQIAVAKSLLDKALPNLTSVDVKQESTRTYVLRAPEPSASGQDWLKQFAPKTIDHEETKA